MKLIENWQDKKLRCHFCLSTKSVKYQVEIVDPNESENPVTVNMCNMCALDRLIDEVKKEADHA